MARKTITNYRTWECRNLHVVATSAWETQSCIHRRGGKVAQTWNVNSYSNGYNLNNVRGSNQNYLISTMQQSDMLQSGMMRNQNQSNQQNNYSIAKDQPVYDYLIIGQKSLGWNVAFYWTVTISIVLLLLGGVAFYVFGKNILKWVKKRK